MLPFNALKKNLKKDKSGFKNLKLAVLADTASQFLCQSIRGYGISEKLDVEVYEAEYNQIDLQVFDGSSELFAFSPEFVLITLSTEHILNAWYKKDRSGQEHFAESLIDKMMEYQQTLGGKLKAKIFVNTLPEINDGVFGNYASKVPSSFIYQLRKYNVLLMELSQSTKNLFVIDFALLQNQIGREQAFDSKMYIGGDMVYSLEFLPWIAKSVVDVIQSLSGSFKKCLILDLDNTTWGGIIGDDGMEGIQIGYLGVGKAFTELQCWAKALKRRGIILAVCSKNTEEIAWEPFASHPDMILKLEDIAVFVANWETKVDNIRHIQSTLNIGFDSMVFLDDNPFEREMVRSAIPEICVPDLPEDPADYMPYLRTLNLFETASFTEEDESRTQQYQEEYKRNELVKSFDNEHDFLKSLEMIADVSAFTPFNTPRVAQLSQRSNQFNLRTVRYTDEDIKLMASQNEFKSFALSLKDKFGDHGLIALVILKELDVSTAFIDTWIMSCRVLKRGMEAFTLNIIAAAAKSAGYQSLLGEYLETKKNGIVKDHYKNLGFVEINGQWVLHLDSFIPKETFIQSL